MSLVIDIADAVVTALNGHDFSQEFTAERKYRVLQDLKDQKGISVRVIPKTRDSEIATRNSALQTVKVDIGVQKRVDFSGNTEPDEVLELMEEVADFFRFKTLATVGAAWEADANEPIFVPEHVEKFNAITSVLTLTFSKVR